LAKPPPPIFNPPLLIHDVVPAAPRETSRHASGSSYTHWRMGPSLFWTHASSKIICLTERREKDGRNALALDVQRSADALVTHTVTCGPRVQLAPQSVWNVLVLRVKD
jgi:hypothetical protein